MQILTKTFGMKKFFFILCFVYIAVMACNCEKKQDSTDKTQKETTYISFTLTYRNSEKEKQSEDSFKTDMCIFDLATKGVKSLATLPYTSQYPLTCYSKEEKQIYYTANTSDNHGDEVFVYDIVSGNSRQITNSYFAVNYIFPLENELFIGAVLRGNHEVVQPFLYNKTENALHDLTWDKDFFIAASAMDSRGNDVYVVGYSEKKSEELLQANKDEGLTNCIYKYDLAVGKWEKILKRKRCYIETMAVDDSILIYRQANREFDAEKSIYKMDLTTENETKIDIDEYTVNSMGDFLGLDGNNLYFTEKCYDNKNVDSYSKLWKVNVNTGEKELLYETESASIINNGFLVKGA